MWENQESEYKWRHGFRVHKHAKQHFFPSFETLWTEGISFAQLGRKVITILGPLKLLAPLGIMLLLVSTWYCAGSYFQWALLAAWSAECACWCLLSLTKVLLHCQKLFLKPSTWIAFIFLLLSKSSGAWEFERAYC